MVATETEILSVDSSPLIQAATASKTPESVESSIGRPSGVYSLTLDEFQSSLCESGKNFGSMNMEEFVNSIWIAEDNQALGNAQTEDNQTIAEQARRTMPMPMPGPLSRKTVDQVWSEIHKDEQMQNNGGEIEKQMTLGDMTLEDFLVKAGIVRAKNQQPIYGIPNFGNNAAIRQLHVGEAAGYPIGADGTMQVSYGGRFQGLGIGSPASNQAGGGRKRIIDGPMEVVVERRQRRMIKNRESAARSRARKKAYTVELEAELNQLKEENVQLKQALGEFEKKRKQQNGERAKAKQPKAERAKEKLRATRRSLSCPSLIPQM